MWGMERWPPLTGEGRGAPYRSVLSNTLALCPQIMRAAATHQAAVSARRWAGDGPRRVVLKPHSNPTGAASQEDGPREGWWLVLGPAATSELRPSRPESHARPCLQMEALI